MPIVQSGRALGSASALGSNWKDRASSISLVPALSTEKTEREVQSLRSSAGQGGEAWGEALKWGGEWRAG